MFKCTIAYIHPDGSYKLHFQADDSNLTVFQSFFLQCLVPVHELGSREEMTNEMLQNAKPKEGEDEVEVEQKSRNRTKRNLASTDNVQPFTSSLPTVENADAPLGKRVKHCSKCKSTEHATYLCDL